MEKVINITILIIWLSYMGLEGFREAFYWHFKNTSSDQSKYEIHPIFLSQRAFVFMIVSAFVISEPKASYYTLISCVICSPFIHNGMYYYVRNSIDGSYPKGFLDQSKTSTAISTKFLTPIVRIGLFVVGIFLLIL